MLKRMPPLCGIEGPPLRGLRILPSSIFLYYLMQRHISDLAAGRLWIRRTVWTLTDK